MKGARIFATMLIIGMGVMGCGAVPEPPLACTEEGLPWYPEGEFTLEYCQALGLVCNEAVTLADECPAFVDELEVYIREVLVPMMSDWFSFLPSFIDLEELVAMLFDQYVGVCGEVEFLDEFGTCQPRGDQGEACAEEADCLAGLACVEGLCVVPQVPECEIDDDCDPGWVCDQGTCVEPPPA